MNFGKYVRVSLLGLTLALCATPSKAWDLFVTLQGHPVGHKVAEHPKTLGYVVASFYGGGPKKYEPNSHTANGERFNQWGLTAAHRKLPFGTRLLVSRGSKSVVVRVTDRGPSLWTGRSLDLSRGAAARLGMIGVGVSRVHVAILGK
jgi:rare lipoprotein A